MLTGVFWGAGLSLAHIPFSLCRDKLRAHQLAPADMDIGNLSAAAPHMLGGASGVQLQVQVNGWDMHESVRVLWVGSKWNLDVRAQ